jgi:sugar phosphate isomerase/epimerase
MSLRFTRREMIRLASLTAAGAALCQPRAALSSLADEMMYGVQLYMVRRQAEKDFAGTMRAIRMIGYRQIELYAMAYSRPVRELRSIIEDAGLGVVSGHFDYYDFEPRIGYARDLGLKYMVCPMVPQPLWSSLDGFREAAGNFNRWGALVKQAGMTFVFHNHDYEFRPQGQSSGFEVLMKATDPALVKLEVDVYWLTQAGQDPMAFLKEHKDRIELFHMKDRVAGAPTSYLLDASAQHFTELGRGVIPWPSLLTRAHKQGVRYAYVDQDETSLPVLESLQASYDYLKSI